MSSSSGRLNSCYNLLALTGRALTLKELLPSSVISLLWLATITSLTLSCVCSAVPYSHNKTKAHKNEQQETILART